ncbi:uncharacterized protein LOC119075546 [Bradysia coprophila]|uniref:uncharacterized protein LOC119073065 n=1 Tax=Bradysia coprophila TaxID=38358 RepID=UPI00187D9EBB|nr:uncharacterized protein LOC119073065 [Bradysia coprophila]XP_037036333.1 uncharacterized protein LOC119074345 [Bradysia coprophila]XP_037037909.1 uncharacterized protein LOC119075546 [Bradysia coprophila]
MFVVLCAIFALALTGTEAQDYATGVQISSFATAEEPTCTKTGPECAADCSTLMICMAGDPTPLDTVLCSSPNQYCVNGACTTKPTSQCTSAPSFTCTDDGVFPEPSDCTRYRTCEAGESSLLQCPTGFVFNSQLNVCQRGTLPCSKIDCSKASTSKPYIVYASNTRFYAYCIFNAGNIRTIMFRCGESEIFDTSINACRLNCKAKGYYQNPSSCNEYFYCSAASAKPSEVMACPPNYVFDGTGCNSDASKCKFPPPAVV